MQRLSELIDYFEVHDFEVVTVILNGDHAGQAVVNHAYTEGKDLALMGIHSVSKVWKIDPVRINQPNIETPVLTKT